VCGVSDIQNLLDRYFEVAFSAPQGVKRLRELILNLAMRGLLVPQDPTAQPARELLREIEAEKDRLIRAGKLKKSNKLPEILPKENPYKLPPSWEWVMLGNLAQKIGSGSTPLGGKNAYVSNGIPFFRSQNIWNEGLRIDDVALIPEEVHKKMQATRVKAKDILLNITGASIGRCAVIPDDFIEGNVSQHVTIVRCIEPQIRRFLHFFLISPLGQSMIWSRQVGVSREGLSKKVLEQFTIPLPPLEEQKRIVEKVDRLMEQCDRLEQLHKEREQKRIIVHAAARDRLLNAKGDRELQTAWEFLRDRFGDLYAVKENISELRKAILQLAVMGKLVPQDPNDPPASELLKEIQAEKQRLISEGKISRQKPLPELQSNTIPMRVPQNWKWVKLEDLVDIITGVSKGKSYKLQEMICLPYLRVANVQRGYVDLEIMKYLSIPLVDLPRYEVLQNDLLITEGGDWDKVGRTAIWKGEITPCIHQNHVFKARKFIKEQDVFWMQLYLNSPVARSYFAGASKQTTNLASINKTQLRGCPIPIPPLPEQHRIVAKVDQLMQLCDQLESKIDQQTQTQTRLLNTLMAELN